MELSGTIITSGTNKGYIGDDRDNKGFFATPTALTTAFPTGQDGWYAVVGTTDTIWIWDADTLAWIDSGSAFVAGGMLVAVYDPNAVEADCFDMDNQVEGATNLILTGAERTKLSGIATGAEVNVNADWDSVSGDSEILNKPSIPTSTADLPDSLNKRYVTDGQLASLAIIDSRRNMSATCNGTVGQVISYSSAFIATRPAIFDYEGIGIEVTAFDVNGFTITSLGSGNFGYETKQDI